MKLKLELELEPLQVCSAVKICMPTIAPWQPRSMKWQGDILPEGWDLPQANLQVDDYANGWH